MKFIIVGSGSVGLSLAHRLVRQMHEVTLVERLQAKAAKATALMDINVVTGNGVAPATLIRAGIRTADYVIAVTNSDEANISVALVAKLINPNAKRIVRIRSVDLGHGEIGDHQLHEFFDLIINPDQAAADHFLQLFQVAGAKEVVDFCDRKLRVLGLSISESSPFIFKKLSDLDEIRKNLPVLVLGIVRANNLFVPKGEDRLLPGDVLYCITEPQRTAVLFEMAGREYTEGKSAIIWCGSLAKEGSSREMAIALANSLSKQGTQVKVIVREGECPQEYVDRLGNALILLGDGTDQALLNEEGIISTDAFFAITEDEEDNILSALLAKRLGVRTSMALVNKAIYLQLVHAIGIDVVVSSREAAAAAIFTHIHPESIVSEFSLRHFGAGFVEFIADKSTPVLGKKLKDCQIPKGVIFAAIVRGGEFFIPMGDDAIELSDRVLVFVTQGAESNLKSLINMNLEFFL